MTYYDVGYLNLGIGKAQACSGIKLVNGIPTIPLLITGSPKAILI